MTSSTSVLFPFEVIQLLVLEGYEAFVNADYS
jgi:hypothetical protein